MSRRETEGHAGEHRDEQVGQQIEDLTRAVLREAAALGRRVPPGTGLLGQDLTALTALDHLAAGPLRVGEIAQRLALSSAATSELADRLERAGLAHRVRDQRDRRVVRLALSDTATEFAASSLAPWGDRILAALDDLTSDAERAAVRRYLQHLLDRL